MTETALVQWDPFVAMDQLDDAAIIGELEGRTIKTLVYQFPQDGKTVSGLSKQGVDAVVREMAKQGEVLRELTLEHSTDDDDPDFVLFRCLAERVAVRMGPDEAREVHLDTAWGVKRQAKYVTRKDGSKSVNPFWYETGSMKAARNARMRLIRDDIKEQVIALAIREGRTHPVAPVADKAEVAGPAALQQLLTLGTALQHSKTKLDARARQDYGVRRIEDLSPDQATAMAKLMQVALTKEIEATEAPESPAQGAIGQPCTVPGCFGISTHRAAGMAVCGEHWLVFAAEEHLDPETGEPLQEVLI